MAHACRHSSGIHIDRRLSASELAQARFTRFPRVEITLPAGVTITGYDGVRKTRIAVERMTPDKLPTIQPPIRTESIYQLYFGSPMRGTPSAPIPVKVPNDLGLEPGETTELW